MKIPSPSGRGLGCLDAIIEYYFNMPKPATKPTIRKRLNFLVGALEETACDGVVSQNLKFCEPFAYDAVTINNALKERGFRVIHVEHEFTPQTDNQLITRLSAFAETIQGGQRV